MVFVSASSWVRWVSTPGPGSLWSPSPPPPHHAALRFLHPPALAEVPGFVGSFLPKPRFALSQEVFTSVFLHLPRLSAGGLSGMQIEHLHDCFLSDDSASGYFFRFALGPHSSVVARLLGSYQLLAMAKELTGCGPWPLGKCCIGRSTSASASRLGLFLPLTFPPSVWGGHPWGL